MTKPILILRNTLTIKRITPNTLNKLKRALTIDNPKYYDALKYGKGKPRKIKKKLTFYKNLKYGLLCPRSFLDECWKILIKQGEYTPEIIDKRNKYKNINVRFKGELKDFQKQAVAKILKKDFGVLRAPTGSGKTIIALNIIAQRKQPTLILVHTKELLDQWFERINKFLQVPMIGILGGGKKEIHNITISTIQTAKNTKKEISERFSHVIIDECHRAPAFQYINVIDLINAYYVLGLSATPYRRDGLTKIMYWYIGPEVSNIESKELKEQGIICHAVVHWIKTNFTSIIQKTEKQEEKYESSTNYPKAISNLTKDENRNNLIVNTIENNKKGGVTLILTDRKEHGKKLQQELNIKTYLLTGSIPTSERKNIVNNLNKGKINTVIATSQLIGEGFDLPSIQTIFLTTPIRYHGRLIQYIGRALRTNTDKDKAYIYDFYDAYDPILRASAESRSKTYKAEYIEEINKPKPPQLKCKKCSKKFRSWVNTFICQSCQNKLFNQKELL